MDGLFPERVETPPGLTKKRVPYGMPPGMGALLVLGGVGPLILFGRQAWWTLVVTLVVGSWLKLLCMDDPDFLTTASGEMKLKRRYH